MKRFLKAVAILAICSVLIAPLEAQGQGRRPGNNGGRPSSGNVNNNSAPASRGNGRPSSSNNQTSRPDNSGTAGRPNAGNNNSGNVGRPNGGNQSYNPGNSNPGNNNSGNVGRPDNSGNNRPDNGVVNNGNPGNNFGNSSNNPGRPNGGNPGNVGNNPGRPDNGNVGNNHGGGNQGYNPGRPNGGNPGNDYSYGARPGVRPRPNTPPPTYRPIYNQPWTRPVPPPSWRPGPRYPTFSTMLGMAFGIGLNASLNYLLSNNYAVYSYGNGSVYLNNVNQLNMIWPDAVLYYGARGLDRGEFVYSTGYYDMNRYNLAYSRLVNAYGYPVSTSYPSGGTSTTWYGYDGRFVTLTYQSLYGADGMLRYYTTLTFGI